jgi:hypothetical protein
MSDSLMHEYDVAFKLVLQEWVDLAMREIAGTTIAKWLNVELPGVQNTRVDLLGETAGGDLIHIELQSTNDSSMALRMAEYCLRVLRVCGKLPQQILVYVGEAPMRMPTEIRGPGMQYSYRALDIRDMDGERLLESPRVGDNIVAILTRLPDLRASVHRVVERIARLEPGQREAALRRLMILAGLRKLGATIEEEVSQMPILNDILDHEVLGREYRKGEVKGELRILRGLIQQRFGVLPAWAEARLSQLSAAELETISLRLLNVGSLEDLLQ